MKEYHFIEAEPLVQFIKRNQTEIIGHTLKNLYTEYWPDKGRYVISDMPVIIEMDNCIWIVNYFVPSDIHIKVCKKAEIEDEDEKRILTIKDEIIDYYGEEFNLGEEKQMIENCILSDIKIERFSSEFEYNIQGDVRPNGGDYFSTIRLYLNSGKVLCFCGADSILDGYIEIWCE